MSAQTGPGTLRTTGCPECGAPAEVTSEGTLDSTGGSVDLVRVRCAARHWFLLPADRLPAGASPGTSRVRAGRARP